MPSLSEVFGRFIRPYAPAVAFLGGFVWDALTLGREIKPLDLFILLAYYLGASVILVLLGREAKFRFSEYLNFALQFFLGGIYSALVIFYFLSSSDLPGFAIVGVLVALLVANEFLESSYNRLSLSWAMFGLAGIMFFNFALPHLFRSISALWFYIGVAAGLAAVFALRTISRQEAASVIPSIAVGVIVVVLFVANLIPPVPLVKKEMMVCRELHKEGPRYVATVEMPRRFEIWKVFRREVTYAPGDRTYVFTSIFIPRGLETTIRHRWMRYDEGAGEWKDVQTVPFPIRGGRRDGYRGYTFKTDAKPGRWRVVAESERGATIGVTTFDVVERERAGRITTLRL
ncbi:MAG: DUF2914 domain-containing protein [Thermoanaerobaculia bacterium]